MKRLQWILIFLSVFLITTCGSDDGMDQNTNDPGNTQGQTDNPVSDADEDGIPDAEDQCPDTPTDEQADENGCSPSQLDSDNDGVNDDLDECPDTPEGEDVNEQGCSDTQKDSDGDGVNDAEDQCPDTPADAEVNEEGCVEEVKTYVPDDGFEQTLIDMGYDDELDDYVLTKNIEEIQELFIKGSPITIENLIGIQDFKKLRNLEMENINGILHLNLNEAPALIRLRLIDVEITVPYTIESYPEIRELTIIGENPQLLPELVINNNKLEFVSLSGFGETTKITDNPILEGLGVYGMITEVIIQNNPGLESITITDLYQKTTLINRLMIQNNTSLEYINFRDAEFLDLKISETQNVERLDARSLSFDFSMIDLGEFEGLKELLITNAGYLNLQELNLSDNTELEYLHLYKTEFTELDVSFNTRLESLTLHDHQVQCIKVNQEQINSIPLGWSVNPVVPYTLDCN